MPETLLGDFAAILPSGYGVDAQAILGAERLQAWNDSIDRQLIEWGARPDFFAAEDFEPPTSEAIAVAAQLAAGMRDAGMVPPDRIAPSGDGGIVFERRWANGCTRVEIEPDGAVWAIALENSKVVSRNRWK